MKEQDDPLTLKIRNTLFEIKRNSLGKVKGRPTKGPLLGVTLMAKNYKSKRKFDHNNTSHNYHFNR
jgi:hypothetical protein